MSVSVLQCFCVRREHRKVSFPFFQTMWLLVYIEGFYNVLKIQTYIIFISFMPLTSSFLVQLTYTSQTILHIYIRVQTYILAACLQQFALSTPSIHPQFGVPIFYLCSVPVPFCIRFRLIFFAFTQLSYFFLLCCFSFLYFQCWVVLLCCASLLEGFWMLPLP